MSNKSRLLIFTLSFLSRRSNILLAILCVGGLLYNFSFLQAENYMELIAELTGEHPRSKFGFCAASLDFNGDSIDDLVVGAHKWDPEYPGWPAQPYSWSKSYFYFGKEEGFGDSIDYHIEGEHHVGLGWSVALGDFNNDNYADIAVGGTGKNASGWNDCWCGKVYVYAGNAELEEADPNIANEEEIISKPNLEFNAYPNPFNPSITFEIKLTTEHTESTESAVIEIYNIKGRKVKTLDLESASPSPYFADGVGYSISWDGTDNYLKPVSSGVYFYKLNVNGKSESVSKCLLLK